MPRSTLSKFAAAALTLACCTAFAAAQTGPVNPAPNPGPGPGGPVAPAPAGLSEEALTAFFRTLDPNVKVTRGNNNANVFFNMNIPRGDWNFNVEASLSQRRVLLYCRLGKPVSDPRTLSPEALVKLLETMNKIAPTYFTYDRLDNGSVRLCLNYGLSREVTIERLQAGMNEFLKDIQDSYPAWSALTN